jgi:hypothetical protein
MPKKTTWKEPCLTCLDGEEGGNNWWVSRRDVRDDGKRTAVC